MVHIELPEDYSSGEVRAVNDAGQAVGWMHYDGDDTDRAFFFDPATASESSHGVTILQFNPTYHDHTWAYGLTNDDPPLIAGSVMWKDSPSFLRACKWDTPSSNIALLLGTAVSEAFAVNTVSSTTTYTGRYEVSTQSRSVVYNGTAYYPASGVEGEARSLNAGGKVVGWKTVSAASHAYAWQSGTTTDIHPSPFDASGANAVNAAGHIGGWVDDGGDILPALWTFISPVYTVEPFDDAGADAVVTALNSHGEMAIMRVDNSPGVAIWSKRAGVARADLLDNITLRHSGDLLNSALAINENGWIGGSFLAGGTGDPLPCLIIPYDVNNNGTSDYREILDGAEADVNENWLIDWAEDMRVGLHAPGQGESSQNIANCQIVRMPLQLRRLDFNVESPGEDSDEWPIDAILQEEELCCGFQERINNWTRVSGHREIVFWLRSTLLEGDDEYDYLPEGLEGIEKDEILNDIHAFSFRFAHCIDYIKTGNEVFGGAGGYKFFQDQLDGCAEWEDAVTFQELESECRLPAGEKVIEWLGEQAWAALEGSALAGRPLRIIGPGMQKDLVKTAYDNPGSTDLDDLMQMIVSWCNANQIYFDLHDLYESLDEAVDTIQKTTDTFDDPPAAPWDQISWIVCMELGPIVTPGTWRTNNSTQFAKFIACDPLNLPGETWWEFVGRWQTDQFNGVTEFAIADAMAQCAAPGGDATRRFAAVCYGPTIQHDTPIFEHDMGALRATSVCGPLIGNGQGSTRYTPLKEMYESAASTYEIEYFDPHPDECTTCGCN